MVEKKPRTITIEGFEMLEKMAKLPNNGSSCVIYLPKEWDGKEIVVIRIE
jgi:hypothetical protein